MVHNLQLAALALAMVALALAAWQRRKQEMSAATKRSYRTTMLLASATAAGVLPSILVPSTTWLLMVGALLSVALTVAGVILLVRPLPPNS